MQIKFLDLKKINDRQNDAFRAQFESFLARGHYIMGTELAAFEKDFAAFCGGGKCLGVANGLDALILILKGLLSLGRLQKGDIVAMQGNTFIATALAAIHADLKIQILAPTEGQNLSLQDIKTQMDPKAKALMLVHLYGEMKDTAEIAQYCVEKGVLLIEDAAQAHGASWKGKRAGSYGIATGFSFYPGKNLGALGDGGAVIIQDEALFAEVEYLRNYGSRVKYEHERVGYNSRLDELQAGFLREKLKTLEADNQRRQVIADQYLQNIKNDKIKLPPRGPDFAQVWHLFVVHADNRDKLVTHLKQRGIDTLIHYPKAVHEYPAMNDSLVGVAPYDEKHLNRNVLSIPLSPVMTEEEVNYVIKALNEY